MKLRSYSQTKLRVLPKPLLQEWVTFQKTSDHTPHRILLQLIENRIEFREHTEKTKPKYTIALRNLGAVKCVESTLILKHLTVRPGNKWIETYVMLRSSVTSQFISKLLLDSMVDNYFPASVKQEEDEKKRK